MTLARGGGCAEKGWPTAGIKGHDHCRNGTLRPGHTRKPNHRRKEGGTCVNTWGLTRHPRPGRAVLGTTGDLQPGTQRREHRGRAGGSEPDSGVWDTVGRAIPKQFFPSIRDNIASYVHILFKRKIYPTIWWLFQDGFCQKIPSLWATPTPTSQWPASTCRASHSSKLPQRRSPSWRSSCPQLLHGQPVWWRGFLGAPQHWHERPPPGPASQHLFYLALSPSGYGTITKNIHDTCVRQTELYHHGEALWEGPADFQPAVWPCKPPCFVRTRSTASTTTWARRWSRTSWCWGFVNRIFRPHLELWKHCLHGAFKEPFGTEGPWSYFSEFGIIWEVMQNPLLQILCLVAMEKAASTNSDDIRDDKSQGVEMYLRGAGEQCGPEPIYGEPHRRRWGHQRVPEDPRVPRGSTTDTFATFIFSMGNERLGRAALHTVLGQSPELAQDWGVSVVPKRGWWCLLAATQTQQTGNPCAAQGCRVCQGDD